MSCSPESRLALIFDVYDRDRDGMIDQQELEEFILAVTSDADDMSELACEMISTLDVDDSGRISKTEFEKAIHEKSAVFSFFDQALPKPPKHVAKKLDSLSDLRLEFTAGNPISAVYTYAKNLRQQHGKAVELLEMSLAEFKAMLRDIFSITNESIAERLFQCFDAKTTNGSVQMDELLQGFSEWLCGDEEAYFNSCSTCWIWMAVVQLNCKKSRPS
jgi:Ca2+-binding EF-hand superfamily protein